MIDLEIGEGVPFVGGADRKKDGGLEVRSGVAKRVEGGEAEG